MVVYRSILSPRHKDKTGPDLLAAPTQVGAASILMIYILPFRVKRCIIKDASPNTSLYFVLGITDVNSLLLN